MSSLLDSVINSISPLITRTLATNLDESATAVEKSLQVSCATILGALASQVDDAAFMDQIARFVSKSGAQGGANVAAAVSGAAGSAAGGVSANFLNLLFGGKRQAVQLKIAQATGLSAPSAPGIMDTASPLVLKELAAKIEGEIDPVDALLRELSVDITRLRAMIPSGMPGLAWAEVGGAAAAEPVEFTSPSSASEQEAKGGATWLWPVLLLGVLLIGSLLWYFG